MLTHYVYLTTDMRNGMMYLGKHSWKGKGIDPSYVGSGDIITSIKKKHNNWREFLKCRIIHIYDTEEESYCGEQFYSELYGVESSPFFYNLCKGGKGGTRLGSIGNTNRKGKHNTPEHREKCRKAMLGKLPWNIGMKMSAEYCKKLSEAHKGQVCPMKGKKHTKESLKKLSEALKGHTPWNKGATYNEEYRKKLSEAHKGIPTNNGTKVNQLKDGAIIATFPTIAEASKITGVSCSVIKRAIANKTVKPRKFNWERTS